MSDILIKNMALPKQGWKRLILLPDGEVREICGDEAVRATDARAVELPPHGKLISTDVLQRELYKLLYSPQISRMNQDEVVEYIIDDIVDKASTVLGASEA